MEFWPFWASGAALAAVPLFNWFTTRRALGVSGRYTLLIDRLRFGREEAPELPLDQAALIEALRSQTALALGPEALELEPAEAPEPEPAVAPSAAAHSNWSHLLFFLGLVLGGALSVLSAGTWTTGAALRGAGFGALTESLGIPAPLLLGFGGLLVGFGTRMAGGCTSEHGLCGSSQLQPGSLLATAAFFGAGVAVSLCLGGLL